MSGGEAVGSLASDLVRIGDVDVEFYRVVSDLWQTEMDDSASAGSNTFGAAIAAYAVDQVFADIWTRPGLDRRSRSLVSMSVMIAMRQPHEFAIHMGAGLNNNLTLKEIEEVLIQALPYVGYPAVATALVAAAEVIKEHGLDADKDYTGHRGLL